MSLGKLSPSSDKEKQVPESHKRVTAHIDKLATNKIAVSKERYEWLEWYQAHSGTAPEVSLLIVNCTGEPSDLAKILSHAFRVQEITEANEDLDLLKCILGKKGSRKSRAGGDGSGRGEVPEGSIQHEALLHTPLSERSDGNPPEDADAVIFLCKDRATMFVELATGSVFLQGRPPLVLADGASGDECERVMRWTGGTWPVFNSEQSLIRYLEYELPGKVNLRNAIQSNLQNLLERHKFVNLTWYAFSRGALALVPFGVHALNTASLVELCRTCMLDAGMRTDMQAQKALATGAGKVGILEFACNSASDVYQLLVQGAILSEMIGAGSVAAAMATLDMMDAFLLGSISVVTGAVAAVAAYVSRPQLVDSITDVMVMLQFTYCMNPELRRSVPNLEIRQVTVHPEAVVASPKADGS